MTLHRDQLDSIGTPSGQAVPSGTVAGGAYRPSSRIAKLASARYLTPQMTGKPCKLQRHLDYYKGDQPHTGRRGRGHTPCKSSGDL